MLMYWLLLKTKAMVKRKENWISIFRSKGSAKRYFKTSKLWSFQLYNTFFKNGVDESNDGTMMLYYFWTFEETKTITKLWQVTV